MPRPPTILTNQFPYHITARCNNRENFPGDPQYIWKVLSDELYLQTVLRKIKVHAFVMMPNHLHLMISTPDWSPGTSGERPSKKNGVSEVMRDFISSSTRIINTKLNRSGRIFGGRYYGSLIPDASYYEHALKYVYRNPVKAKLCKRPEDYQFSTLPALTGLQKSMLPITEPGEPLTPYLRDTLSPAFLIWLNQPHPAEVAEAIRKALRKREFKFPEKQKIRKAVQRANLSDS